MGVNGKMHLCSLADTNIPLVADASVIINIISSGAADEVISSIPNPIYVVDEIILELERGKLKGYREAEMLHSLIKDDFVHLVSLDEKGWEYFEPLVTGDAISTLDDGEAATIAYCAANKFIPVIDERKGIRICKEQFPHLNPLSSTELFMLAKQHGHFHENSFAEYMYCALQEGKMRVLPAHIDWVVELIGPKKAINCNSLPLCHRESLLVIT